MQRPAGVHERGDAIERDDAVAVCPRHAIVDLGQHDPRRLRGGLGGVDRCPQGAVSVRVRRRELQQRDVERNAPTGEQGGDVGEEDRDELGAPLLDGPAKRGPCEERVRQHTRRRPVDEGARASEVEQAAAPVRLVPLEPILEDVFIALIRSEERHAAA